MPRTLLELASLSFNAADPITLESPTFQINGVSTSHPTTPTHYASDPVHSINEVLDFLQSHFGHLTQIDRAFSVTLDPISLAKTIHIWEVPSLSPLY